MKLGLKSKKALLALSFVLFTSSQVLAEEEKKVSIIINTIKDNLFSTLVNGGREMQAFISSDEDYNNIQLKEIPYNVFKYKNDFILLNKTFLKENENKFDTNKITTSFFRNTIVFEHDVNDYLTIPEEESEDFLKYASQKYKLIYPFSKVKLVEKVYLKLEYENKTIGYLITEKDNYQSKVAEIMQNKELWLQRITITFLSKIKNKNYSFILSGNDPTDALKVQYQVKTLSKLNPKENTLKISYGDLTSGDNKERLEIESENLKNNAYDAILPSEKEFSFLENEKKIERLTQISGASPFIVSNIKPKTEKGKDLFKPYTIAKVNGLNIALIGIVDDFLPKANSSINKASIFAFEKADDSLDKVLKEVINKNEVDLVLILNNIISSQAKLQELENLVYEKINKYPQKQFLFFSLDEQLDYVNRAEKSSHKIHYDNPELCINIPLKSDVYLIDLKIKDKYVSDLEIKNEKLSRVGEVNESKALQLLKKALSEVENFLIPPDEKEAILPDLRIVTEYLKGFNKKLETDTYSAEFKAKLVSGVLLDKYASEIAIVKKSYFGGNSIGHVHKDFFREWFGQEEDKIVTLALKGSEIKALINIDKQIKIFQQNGILSFNGINIEKNLVRNRSINDNELYRIVTSENIFNNLLLQDVFRSSVNVNIDNNSVWQTVSSYFKNLSAKYNVDKKGFTKDYLVYFTNLIEDKSEKLSNEWKISLKALTLDYNKDDITGNEKYISVKDSRVNAPNLYTLGFSGRLSSLFDTEILTFENVLSSVYNKNFISLRENNETKTIQRKGKDDISISTDLQLKFISVNLKDYKVSLVPFVNSTYSTEFEPTINTQTNRANNRRSELNNSAGVVLYPGFIDEVRFGFLGRTDFSSSNPLSNLFNTGYFSSFESNYLLGNAPSLYEMALSGNYKYLMPAVGESVEQLSTYGELNARLAIPIFEKIKISINANAFIFKGNLELRNQDFGYGFKTSIGLGYNFNFKPLFGSYF